MNELQAAIGRAREIKESLTNSGNALFMERRDSHGADIRVSTGNAGTCRSFLLKPHHLEEAIAKTNNELEAELDQITSVTTMAEAALRGMKK